MSDLAGGIRPPVTFVRQIVAPGDFIKACDHAWLLGLLGAKDGISGQIRFPGTS